MKSWLLVLPFFLVSCSSVQKNPLLQEGKLARTYSYRDASGEFECAREIKRDKAKLATRTRLMSATKGDKLVEKTFALSELGSVKTKQGRATAIRPSLAQHTVWLEGKKYFSQLKLVPSTRKLNVIMQSPEAKWNGQKNLNLPSGRIFCFYSQLPECLYLSGLLDRVASEKGARTNFYVVWDSYPYHQEQFEGLGESPFSSARVVLEKRGKTYTHYNVEMADQVLGLHFNKSGEFIRLLWTNQGISITPPNEGDDSVEQL